MSTSTLPARQPAAPSSTLEIGTMTDPAWHGGATLRVTAASSGAWKR
ncbi:hypothetical protein ABZ863_12755 [Saccharomonospora sp. NPDC046836]